MKIVSTQTLRTGKPGAYVNVPPGVAIDVPDEDGQSLVERGLASEVVGDVVREEFVLPPEDASVGQKEEAEQPPLGGRRRSSKDAGAGE